MRRLAWLAAWAAARAAPDEATLLARAAALDRWFREGVPPTIGEKPQGPRAPGEPAGMALAP